VNATATAQQKKTSTILVVEDDCDLRELLAEILARAGYSVVQAANGKEALECLCGVERPRLILLDLSMPVMNGWQFHEALKANERLADIPVLVVSARRDGEKALPVASERFLRKPFELASLLDMVGKFT
jgi:CheY-like chemotaxis protein